MALAEIHDETPTKADELRNGCSEVVIPLVIALFLALIGVFAADWLAAHPLVPRM